MVRLADMQARRCPWAHATLRSSLTAFYRWLRRFSNGCGPRGFTFPKLTKSHCCNFYINKQRTSSQAGVRASVTQDASVGADERAERFIDWAGN